MTLSAEEYRAEITAIDRLVFEEGPFRKERGAALEAKLVEVARRVKATSDSRFLALEALEIRRLAAMTGSESSSESRARLSREWMRIRSNLFDDRSWFARSAADIEAPPKS